MCYFLPPNEWSLLVLLLNCYSTRSLTTGSGASRPCWEQKLNRQPVKSRTLKGFYILIKYSHFRESILCRESLCTSVYPRTSWLSPKTLRDHRRKTMGMVEGCKVPLTAKVAGHLGKVMQSRNWEHLSSGRDPHARVPKAPRELRYWTHGACEVKIPAEWEVLENGIMCLPPSQVQVPSAKLPCQMVRTYFRKGKMSLPSSPLSGAHSGKHPCHDQ